MGRNREFQVDLDLEAIIEAEGIDGFNDLLESTAMEQEQIGENDVLSDIGYSVISVGKHDMLTLKVSAIVERIGENEDEEDEDEEDED